MPKPINPEEKARRLELRRENNKQNFIAKASVLYNNKYDYSDIIFVNVNTLISLQCPVHKTTFEVYPEKHLRRKAECPLCTRERASANKINQYGEVFVEKARLAHGDRYDYSKAVYKGNKKKVVIICEKHGEFKQTPDTHLGGKGCGACAIEKVAEDQRSDLKTFAAKCFSLFGDAYDFSESEYIAAKEKIRMKCKFCGSEIVNTPDNITSRVYSCDCVSSKGPGGFKPYLPGILYYLRVEHLGYTAYKIGITNRSVEYRYLKSDLDKITVIKEWSFPNGADARLAETKILQDFAVYNLKGVRLLRDGNSELFDRDVLELDTERRVNE